MRSVNFSIFWTEDAGVQIFCDIPTYLHSEILIGYFSENNVSNVPCIIGIIIITRTDFVWISVPPLTRQNHKSSHIRIFAKLHAWIVRLCCRCQHHRRRHLLLLLIMPSHPPPVAAAAIAVADRNAFRCPCCRSRRPPVQPRRL